MLSENFMQKLKKHHGDKASRFLNEYVAYACTLGFHKNIADQLP